MPKAAKESKSRQQPLISKFLVHSTAITPAKQQNISKKKNERCGPFYREAIKERLAEQMRNKNEAGCNEASAANPLSNIINDHCDDEGATDNNVTAPTDLVTTENNMNKINVNEVSKALRRF